MNIPSVPTDNLYKFLAIFGLIIFLASIYLNGMIEEKTHQTASQVEFLENKNRFDSLNVAYEKAKLDQLMKKHKIEHEENPHTAIDEDKMILEIDKYQIEQNKYSDSTLELLKKEKELVFYARRQFVYFIYYVILGFCGILCMIIGFRLWYIKHQVYIDAERKWKGETFVELLKDAEQLKNSKVSETTITKEDKEQSQES